MFDDVFGVFGVLVRGKNAPYHGVTGAGGTSRKVVFYTCMHSLL
jgi:hypothetical protein